jgi:hypothetical protein
MSCLEKREITLVAVLLNCSPKTPKQPVYLMLTTQRRILRRFAGSSVFVAEIAIAVTVRAVLERLGESSLDSLECE